MKKFLRLFVTAMLALSLCLAVIPGKVNAWKNLTHVNSADLILLELKRSVQQNGVAKISLRLPYGDGTVYSYDIPNEYVEAMFAYPDAFRAGSMGPDFYPDMITGQGFIHPYDYGKKIGSGEWITMLVDSVNNMPQNSNARKEALAFTLGFMLHYCGDLYGHDFINSFAGGTYPLLDEVDYLNGTDRNLNIILSHMSEETYMDSQVNWNFYNNSKYLNIAAPIQFIQDTLLFDGNVNNGPASIYSKYGKLPTQYDYLIDLRMKMYKQAEEWRPSVDPLYTTAVKFLDAWVEDLDAATYALVECFDNMANKMVTQSDPDTLKIVEEELQYWVDNYGKYVTPAPDIIVDGIHLPVNVLKLITEAIGLDEFIDDVEEWMMDQVEELALSALGFVGLKDSIDQYKARMKDPSVQLDDAENPFKPSANNFEEFKEYMDRYKAEQDQFNGKSLSQVLNGNDGGALDNALDSDLEAFYNTLTMFKLVLMGPDNFTNFIQSASGVKQNLYVKNRVNYVASSLKVRVKTAKVAYGGTDDNIYVEVFRTNGKLVCKKLLDKSNYDDFEQGDDDTYVVELGENVRLDEMEVKIYQEKVMNDDWNCESIAITPVHAGADILDVIAFPGKSDMKAGTTWDLHFHDELMERISGTTQWTATSASLKIKTKDGSWTDTYGTDSNVYLDVYWGNSRVKAIKLDLSNYNDFEMGDDDTYNVSLAYGDKRGVPLNQLNFMLRLDGSDAWTVSRVKITTYHGEFQLTDTIEVGGTIKLDNSTYNLDVNSALMLYARSYTPLSISYDTYVDDGLIKFIGSLDDSHQWVNGENILWNNTTIRSNVFFKIFKGFGCDVKIGNSVEITEGDKFDLGISLEGMWNGITASRRESVLNAMDMPDVNGSVTIRFINHNTGANPVTFTQSVSKGDASLYNYSNASLTSGVYDVQISFTPDANNQQYANSEKTFESVLTVNPKPEITYVVKFQVVNGRWEDGTTGEKTMTLGGTSATKALLGYMFPSVGNKPNEGYTTGKWNVKINTQSIFSYVAITQDTTIVYTYLQLPSVTRTVTFKVENGTWDDGTTADKIVQLTGYQGQILKLEASQIPAVGANPDTGYQAGAWDQTVSTDQVINSNRTYTYVYAARNPISRTVTFKVANGTWDDGTTEDKIVTINGYEGDELILDATQIPAVGNKPEAGYKAGAWDETPDVKTGLTADSTYTYSYEVRNPISQTVTFKVVNGTWDNDSTEDVVVMLNGLEGDVLTLDATQIPAVGTKPAEGYTTGIWDVTPVAGNAIAGNPTYVYVYANKKTISQTVTFQVAGGTWDDGTTEDKIVTLGGFEGDELKLSASQIPVVGTKPSAGYKAGAWNVTPSVDTVISENTTYVYSYTLKDTISKQVTFKVVGGAWDDGTTDDVVVTVSALEGDELKLDEKQIPGVGTKPDASHKVGAWEVTPSTKTIITADETYTYVYADKAKISQTVTFKVVNGAWDNDATDDVIVVLSGLEGDELKLDATQIPAVGTKPGANFKEGAWDVIPVADTAITGNPTYTYSYVDANTFTATVTFKVVGGAWDDGTTEDVIVNLIGLTADDLKLDAAQIPAVGSKPDAGHTLGSWDAAPETGVAITGDLTYTYNYAEAGVKSWNVTFKVRNGSWDDGSTEDKIVTLSGAAGEELGLTAAQIPAVGSKPGAGYKAGTWDVVPSEGITIIGNTTYVYTYENANLIELTVTFKVVNGFWDDGTDKDKIVTLSGASSEILRLDAAQIPGVGTKPAATFKGGVWDVTPTAGSAITENVTYTFTYCDKDTLTHTVTFKVVNGAWNDGTKEDKIVTLGGVEGDDLKLNASQIPAAGEKPDDTFKTGSWIEVPVAGATITDDKTYTYAYETKEPVNRIVTFRVVNGSWDDGTTADVSIMLSGYEGDELKFDASQIPAVGLLPDGTYKAGAWDVTPAADTAVTENVTYTYTFAKKTAIMQTVTFKVVNGLWDDGTAEDKTVTLTGYEGDVLKLDATQIPAAGANPAATYKLGAWNAVPVADAEITGNPTYTYVYAKKSTIKQTVTFKVENGSWDDGTTEDKVVTLKGYEGDVLMLSAAQIPSAGSRPDEKFKKGLWNAAPVADVEITGNPTYTYSYVMKNIFIVTFDVDGGSQIASVMVYGGDSIAAPQDPQKKSWYFTGWFADEARKVPYDFNAGVYEDTVVYASWTAIAYNATKDVKHKNGSDEEVVIIVKRNFDDSLCFNHFTGVSLNGKQLVNGVDYTAAPGSTVITLSGSILKDLPLGEHTVKVFFDDGSAEVKLNVQKLVFAPRTEDVQNFLILFTILVISSIALVLLLKKKYATKR